jgi:hypothetical protein
VAVPALGAAPARPGLAEEEVAPQRPQAPRRQHDCLRRRRDGDGPFGVWTISRALASPDSVIVYGIASGFSHDVADFYDTREEAEAALAQVFRDAPELEGTLWIERVELAELSLN